MAKRHSTQLRPIVWIIIIFLVAGAAWYFTQREAPETGPEPVAEPEEPGVEVGDLIAINYVLTLANGTVVDTNNEALAKEYNVTKYVKGPFRFIVGQSGKLKGFDKAVVGMTPGQERTKIIPPSEPVLQYAVNRTRSISRNQPIPRYQPILIKAFNKTFGGKKPVIGDVAYSPEVPWPIKIINITDSHVIVEPMVSEGKEYQLPGYEWKSTLLVKTFNDLLFRHNPKDGQIIKTEYGHAIVNPGPGRVNITYMAEQGDVLTYYAPIQGTISIPFSFQITEVNNANFTLTRIGYPPQETLVLTATLLDWEPDVEKRRTVVAQ
jgi:hypothetical protein